MGTSVKNMLLKKKTCKKRWTSFQKEFEKNTIITKKHLLKHRPPLGIRARDIDNVIGKKLLKDVKKLNPVYSSNLI